MTTKAGVVNACSAESFRRSVEAGSQCLTETYVEKLVSPVPQASYFPQNETCSALHLYGLYIQVTAMPSASQPHVKVLAR